MEAADASIAYSEFSKWAYCKGHGTYSYKCNYKMECAHSARRLITCRDPLSLCSVVVPYVVATLIVSYSLYRWYICYSMVCMYCRVCCGGRDKERWGPPSLAFLVI
jgi:hypothetical protein